MKRRVESLYQLLDAEISAAIRRGLIEATPLMAITTPDQPISAAIRRGLIEAGIVGDVPFHAPTISAAIRRGLIEARDGAAGNAVVGVGFPRPFAAASLKQQSSAALAGSERLISAAIRRGLIEARYAVAHRDLVGHDFRGHSPRPH